MYFLSTFT